jgi:hypothetical protein
MELCRIAICDDDITFIKFVKGQVKKSCNSLNLDVEITD